MIREIRESELPQLLQLYRHLHTNDDPLPSPETIALIWSDIQENPDLLYFGLFLDDLLVSSCTLSIIPNLTRACRPYGVIENVVTDSAHRGRGYGKKILKHALACAWSRHCYKAMLLTGRKDEAVYRFYESVGFDRNAKQAFLAKPPLGTE